MWVFRSPGGPLAKFSVTNIHALNEIKLIGNCIKYSRPLLSFDKSFEESPHLQLLKELFTQCFNSPRGHPKALIHQEAIQKQDLFMIIKFVFIILMIKYSSEFIKF